MFHLSSDRHRDLAGHEASNCRVKDIAFILANGQDDRKMMDTGASILHFAKRFFAGTLLSRFSGALRDIVMAICFGGCPEVGAFMVAYRLTHLFRRLLGEGNLASGFVPHFEAQRLENPKRALQFYRDSAFSFLVILTLLVLVLEGVFWGLTFFVNPAWREMLTLAMLMAPCLIFICLYALNGAFLQCQRSFFPFAFAPVFFNFCWIVMAFLFKPFPRDQAVRLLSMGMTIAFALQWGFTASKVRQFMTLSWKEWFQPQLFSLDWKKMMKPIFLGILGIGAVQINSALDAIFARISDPSGPAFLWYAIRFQQLPLALIGISLTGAALAPLSRAIQEGDKERYIAYLIKVLKSSIALLLPCTFAFFVLGGPILNLFYGHGEFTSLDVQKTLYCLWGYGLGLVPSVLVLLLATGFYAKRSFGLPALASTISVMFNVILNVVMVYGFQWGAFSIAIGTSFSTFLNFGILFWSLSRFLQTNIFSGMGTFCLKLCIACIGASVLTVELGGGFTGSRSLSEQLLQCLTEGVIFMGTFAFLSYVLKLQEIKDLLKTES